MPCRLCKRVTHHDGAKQITSAKYPFLALSSFTTSRVPRDVWRLLLGSNAGGVRSSANFERKSRSYNSFRTVQYNREPNRDSFQSHIGCRYTKCPRYVMRLNHSPETNARFVSGSNRPPPHRIMSDGLVPIEGGIGAHRRTYNQTQCVWLIQYLDERYTRMNPMSDHHTARQAGERKDPDSEGQTGSASWVT